MKTNYETLFTIISVLFIAAAGYVFIKYIIPFLVWYFITTG